MGVFYIYLLAFCRPKLLLFRRDEVRRQRPFYELNRCNDRREYFSNSSVPKSFFFNVTNNKEPKMKFSDKKNSYSCERFVYSSLPTNKRRRFFDAFPLNVARSHFLTISKVNTEKIS